MRKAKLYIIISVIKKNKQKNEKWIDVLSSYITIQHFNFVQKNVLEEKVCFVNCIKVSGNVCEMKDRTKKRSNWLETQIDTGFFMQ